MRIQFQSHRVRDYLAYHDPKCIVTASLEASICHMMLLTLTCEDKNKSSSTFAYFALVQKSEKYPVPNPPATIKISGQEEVSSS